MTKPSSKLPHCQYCDEPVKWAFVARPGGRRIPLDASPDPAGNFLVYKRRDGDGHEHTVALWLDAQEAASERARGALLWKAHQATCAKRPGQTAPRVDPDWLAKKIAALNLPEKRKGRRERT